MLITKKIIDLVIYAHENGVDMKEVEIEIPQQEEAGEPVPKKKRNKKPEEPRAPSGASIADKEVLRMRQFISVQKALGKMSEEQIAAMKELSGTFARNLSVGQREQLRNIYEDLKK